MPAYSQCHGSSRPLPGLGPVGVEEAEPAGVGLHPGVRRRAVVLDPAAEVDGQPPPVVAGAGDGGERRLLAVQPHLAGVRAIGVGDADRRAEGRREGRRHRPVGRGRVAPEDVPGHARAGTWRWAGSARSGSRPTGGRRRSSAGRRCCRTPSAGRRRSAPGRPPAPAGRGSAGRCPAPGRPAGVRTTTAPARASAASMVCGSSAMPTCPRPASALPRNTRSPGSTSAAPTGVVTANRSAWVAGQRDARGPVHRLHQRSAVPRLGAGGPGRVGQPQGAHRRGDRGDGLGGEDQQRRGLARQLRGSPLRSPARGGHRDQTGGQTRRRVGQLGRGRERDARSGQLVDVGLPVGRRPVVDVDLLLLQLRQLAVDVAQGGVELVGHRVGRRLELGHPGRDLVLPRLRLLQCRARPLLLRPAPPAASSRPRR